MKKQKIFNPKGITLVALVITIIILLILAGITISQLTGSGLFENARLAEGKYKNAEEVEEGILEDYENKIGEYVEGSRDTVTISKEEYENLKPKGINSGASLLYSTNDDLETSSSNLTAFTNDFYDSFDTYFTYDSTTGELNCIKSGWYCIKLKLDIASDNASGSYSYVDLSCKVNDIIIGTVSGYCISSQRESLINNDSVTLFLNSGDKIIFSRDTQNVNLRNKTTVNIIKL